MQRRAGVDQLVDGGDVGAVAFEDAVGDMDLRLEAEMAQVAGHQSAGAGAVDVVVAEQRHLLVVGDGARRGARPGASMSVSVDGSGIRSRMVGLR